ncbi:MAG: S46 family peptidase [Bacteroidetes bacterium]|nr:MAG: S46 family peptidase [Bacteroidota bacterium]
MIRKTTILLFVFLVALTRPGKADEGMWLPFMINDMLYEQMQEMGLELTREQIFSFNESSIKDAIVSFGGGCTGEIISSQGLLLTNHHCGYGRIQYHSTPENDILTDGFWAMTMEEELPNPGLFVRFLVAVNDVSEAFDEVLNDDMKLEERNRIIRDLSEKLVKDATEGSHYTANVRPMFAGNEFYLFTYERFDDVRLVGTPPSSIGKFGGDTDNWMWPRHTGDFALFRVYTAPDGTPSEYHQDNVPLQPKHHLPVSLRGLEEGDFAMVLGFPGSTDRYLTSYGIDYKLNTELPIRIDIRRQKLDIIEAAMAESDEIRIMYASRQSGISNYWKNFIGMSNSLERNNVAHSKKVTEEDFVNWVSQNPSRRDQYGEVMDMFARAYKGFESFQSFNYIHSEAIATGPDLVRMAGVYGQLETLLKDKASSEEIEKETQRLRSFMERFYRNYNMEVDKQLWAAMMQTYYLNVPAHLRPDIFNEVIRKFKGDFNRFADEVYKKSVFASPAALEQFLDKPRLKTLQNDWAFRMAMSLNSKVSEVRSQMAEYNETLEKARRLFIRGLREMDPEGMFYPDANGTMRFTFGSVRGYWPSDAVYFDYVTTLEGVMEKEDPNHHEFVVPDKLTQLYLAADYAEYSSNETLIVNFISNNDITGGNSGSPVLDGQGNLIGLAFDGNWEAMSGDILFEHQMQRCINVDARYILFVIDKFAGAGHLIEEMTIVR